MQNPLALWLLILGTCGPTGGPPAPDTATTCADLAQPCASTDDCLCGTGAGCAWDNVTCQSGACITAWPLDVDAGAPCCLTCERAWQAGGDAAGLESCSAACGEGACPVQCLGP